MAIDQEASESSNASPNPNSDNADLYLNAGTSNGGNRFPEVSFKYFEKFSKKINKLKF